MVGLEPPAPLQGTGLAREYSDAEGYAFSFEENQLLEERLERLRSVRLKRRLFAVALVVSDALAFLVAVSLSQLARGGSVDLVSAIAVLAGAFPIYFLAALQTGAHSPAISHMPWISIQRAVFAFAGTAAIFFLLLFFAKLGSATSRLLVGQALVTCLVLGAAGRYAIALRAKKLLAPKPFADLCIYDGVPFSATSGTGAISASEAGLAPDLARPETVRRLGDIVHGMDRVIIHCPEERRELWSRALKCVDIPSEIVMPELTQLMPLGVRYRGGKVSLDLSNGPLRWHQHVTKKLFDRAFASVALVLAGPIMIAIALAIKLDSPGPVFFRQPRIGLGNRRFNILKFRTMRLEDQDLSASKLTERDDPRVTKIGWFLRRTSLDELPQLLNVLAGTMSVVGPRPHALKALAGQSLYWEVDDGYWYRHAVKPGITGLAQVRGYRGNTFQEADLVSRLQADLEYLKDWSLTGDIKIIFLTLLTLTKNAF